jgi:hypothetical protein
MREERLVELPIEADGRGADLSAAVEAILPEGERRDPGRRSIAA